MSQISDLTSKRGTMLGISNKGMQLSLDRLTLYLTTCEMDKAKKELKIIKEQTAEMEQLIAEYEKIERV